MFNSDRRNEIPFEDMRTSVNILMLFAETYAFAAEIFLHHRFGCRSFGWKPLFVLILIPFHCAAWQGSDARWLMIYWHVFLVMWLLYQFVFGKVRDIPSYYDGYPWLLHFVPNRSVDKAELVIKEAVEPAILCISAMLLHEHNPPAASFLGLASFSLYMKHQGGKLLREKMALHRRDQIRELKAFAKRLRRLPR